MGSDQIVSRQPSAALELTPPKAKSALAVNPLISRRLALCAFMIVCGSAAHAQQGGDIQGMVSYLFAYSFPTNPMQAGVKEIKIVPAYMTENDVKAGGVNYYSKLSGEGGAASLIWAFSPHFGVSVLAAGVSANGMEVLNQCNSSCGPLVIGNEKGTGYVGAVSLVYDPFGGDGFRLPFVLGGGEVNYTSTINNASLGEKTVGGDSGLGLVAGFSPQFNVWKFRVAPFALVAMTHPGSSTVTTYNPQTGASISQTSTPMSGGIGSNGGAVGASGIDIAYRPWGLGLTYMPSFLPHGPRVAAYTLKWVKRFGGSSDEAKSKESDTKVE